MSCPTCGTPAEPGARFCFSCGSELQPLTDERRVATVLFGDLVGFTAMSEHLDPEAVKRLIDRCFARLASDVTDFGGQVNKIVGDGIVALFGAPVAHENDAERAVRAALRMQGTIAELSREIGATGRELQMRIGVNTGEMLVGAIAADGEYTAMGDVVNTASRLQTMAEPGSVVVGAGTHAATERVIRYESLVVSAVRGRDEPANTWVAVDALLPPGYRPTGPSTPLVGRRAELDMLNAAVSAAIRTKRAAHILVVGDAGLGKTRLVDEVLAIAEAEHGALSLGGRCVPYGEANVWWPIAEVLREGYGLEPDESPDEVRAKVHAGTRVILGPDASEALVDEVSSGLVRQLGLGDDEPIDPVRARDEAVRAALHMQRAHSTNQPVVIRIADLHWADDLVLEYLDELIAGLGRVPVVYIGTARASIDERWQPRAGRHNTVILNLDPLTADASSELLDLLAKDIEPALAMELVEKSGGNPFFLEELVSLIDSNGNGSSPEGVAANAASSGLPATLRGLLAARIDSLASPERAVLQDAAVFGSAGYTIGLERMAEVLRGDADVAAPLRVLVTKDILTLNSAGAKWQFRNDMMREVAYSTITKADRAARHWGIAEHLGAENLGADNLDGVSGSLRTERIDVVAHHLATAAELVSELGPLADVPGNVGERAIEWLTLAGRRAAEDEYHTVSEAVHRRALSLAGADHPDRAVLRLRLGEALVGLGEIEDAHQLLSESRAAGVAAGDTLLTARSDHALGDLAMRTGRYADGIEQFQLAMDGFEAVGQPERAAEALREIGLGHLFLDQLDEAEEQMTRSLDVFAEMGDLRGEGWALQNLAWLAFQRGHLQLAESRIHGSVERFTEIDDTMGLSWAEGLRAFVCFHRGHFGMAAELADQVLEWARDRGDSWIIAMMRTLGASISLWRGETAEAVAEAQAALTAFGDSDQLQGRVQAAATLGRALVMSGQVEEGFAVFDRHLGAKTMSGMGVLGGIGVPANFGSAVWIGDLERARACMPDESATAEPHAVGGRELLLHRSLFHLMTGEVDLCGTGLAAFASPAAAGDEVPGGPGDTSGADALADPLALVLRGLHQLVLGDAVEARTLAAEAAELDRSTYSDRAMAHMVTGLAHAVDGAATLATEAFARAVAEVEPTGDAVTTAIVRLGAARALRLMNVEGAVGAEANAQAGFDNLGLTGDGWSELFAQISV